MKNSNSAIKILAMSSLVGLIIAFGLLEYHYSFDPYGWLEPGFETVESRNFWNDRKWHYVYFGAASFTSLFLSTLFLFFGWIGKKKGKVK